jgi:hypothetical protein
MYGYTVHVKDLMDYATATAFMDFPLSGNKTRVPLSNFSRRKKLIATPLRGPDRPR